MNDFIPSGNGTDTNLNISNDGFYPDLTVDELRNRTGLGSEFKDARIIALAVDAMIEINTTIMSWRQSLNPAYSQLASIPCAAYGDEPEKVHLYKTALCTRIRAVVLETTRDYDSTRDGHNKADQLEAVSGTWFRQSAEAIARLTDRNRATIELI